MIRILARFLYDSYAYRILQMETITKVAVRIHHFQYRVGVFSDIAASLQDLSCGRGADPEFLVSDTGQTFFLIYSSELCILV